MEKADAAPSTVEYSVRKPDSRLLAEKRVSQAEEEVPVDYDRHGLRQRTDICHRGEDGRWNPLSDSDTKKRGQRPRRKRYEELLTRHSSDNVQGSQQKRGGCWRT